MPLDAGISAAIIAAVTSTATAVSSQVANEVQSSGTWVSAIFENRTNLSFDVDHCEPNHGSWKKTASRIVGIDEFVSTLRSKDLPSDGDVQKKLEEWIQIQVLSQKVGGFFAGWGLQGEGAGVEGLVTFKTAAEGNARIVCLIRKIPGGGYGAGVSLSNGGWLKFSDKYGSNMIDHIKDIHSGLCQFSEGGTVRASLGSLHVQVTAGQSVEFVVTRDGVG
jgi:hypothetical protein